MVTTCFFCQSMLSDFMEGLLPSSRQEELQKHLDACRRCTEVQRELQTTIELAQALPVHPIDHETALRIAEACQAGARKLSPLTVSRWALAGLVPLFVLGSMIVLFPQFFPWLSRFAGQPDSSEFVRYFPMLEGAGEIVEEHGNWLHVREPAMRSLWEEGGISPEEFEKSFTGSRVNTGPGTEEEAK